MMLQTVFLKILNMSLTSSLVIFLDLAGRRGSDGRLHPALSDSAAADCNRRCAAAGPHLFGGSYRFPFCSRYFSSQNLSSLLSFCAGTSIHSAA